MDDKINRQQYWIAISILLRNYHTINKKLSACIINNVQMVHRKVDRQVCRVSVDQCVLLSHLQNVSSDQSNECEEFVCHCKCLPKKSQHGIEAVAVLDILNNTFRLTFESTIDDFEVKFCDGFLYVKTLNSVADAETSVRWAEYILKPKLLKWAKSVSSPADLKALESGGNCSLRLLDIEKYNKLYNDFKNKYSEKAMKFWDESKESTDPSKYIFEDLAIAAYLITLWREDSIGHSPQAFADLGCGNGLLVYVLIEEGFTGYGYDVRSRKLWSFYPSKVAQNLYEETIHPFTFRLPPNVDWIIGNHSDELSPWIPVLAATGHYQMNYFLLPCCSFEFSGNKFQRRDSSVSAYNDFCQYVSSISSRCGFETEKDRLKIPSTKRIAFIGRRRNYSSSAHVAKIEEIKEFISKEQHLHPNTTYNEIKLREKIETVRNCTQIDKVVINKLVMKIFLLLLNEKYSSAQSGDNEWLVGRSLTMSQIAKELGNEYLKEIKAECGGLKTLLRNKHEIFELYKPDFVKIRKPRLLEATNKAQTVKKRPCFFYENHPQGCPLSKEECTFVH